MTRGRTQPVSHGDAESGQLLQVQRVLVISGDSRPTLPAENSRLAWEQAFVSSGFQYPTEKIHFE